LDPDQRIDRAQVRRGLTAIMRISLCNEVVGEFDFAAQCALAREFGYDGVEIAPFTLSDDPPRLTAAQRKDIRKIASDQGLAITSLHYLLRAPAELSITSVDGAQRNRTVEVMRGLCALAADLGAKVLVHGSPDQRKLAGETDDDGRKRGADCFAAVADAAALAGVVYCIEPLSRDQTAFVNTIEEAVTIVREIGSPAVKTMLDCSSAALAETESVPDLIRRWIPTGMIAHVHFNDPNRRGPGDGDLDFGPILRALRDQNYQGDAAIEPFIYEPDGPACAARGIAHIRKLLDVGSIA
jgi:sugar phosphate isomerase/epimerase